jgi:glycosyltransferase involved in cell wall biosynthesis
VLEALSLGVPALVTDTSGLGELAGQGLARAIPPDSTSGEIAQAVLEELAHPRAPAAIRLPTWDDCARKLWDLYEDIIGSSESGIRHANSDAQPVLSADSGRD